MYPLLVRMPQRAAQSLVTGVSVRKRISGLWADMRAMMSVFEGLCRPVFCVFCVMMMRSVCMSVCCSVSCEKCCCVGFECGSANLYCVLWLWGKCGFCLGVFGSEVREVRLYLGRFRWVLCCGGVWASIRCCVGCVVVVDVWGSGWGGVLGAIVV